MGYSKNISAVITVYNKKNTIQKTVESLLRQPIALKEIYIIDDGSSDGSVKIIEELAAKYENIRCIFQKRQGVTAALNAGLRRVSDEFVIVLDADIILEDKWIDKLMPYFHDERVVAASGLTQLANDKNVWSFFGGYSVEYRQSKIRVLFVDHLSTCNTIYRKSALEKVGLFDADFVYGQDNDLSYKLTDAGYKLILSKETFCLHFWPEDFKGFMKQRFYGAIGRMKLFKKYPNRWRGDKVSGLPYFLELPLGLFFLSFLLLSLSNRIFLGFAAATIFFIYLLQLNEIKFFFRNKKGGIGLFLPFLSLLRSLAWTSGVIFFCFSELLQKK